MTRDAAGGVGGAQGRLASVVDLPLLTSHAAARDPGPDGLGMNDSVMGGQVSRV